MKIIKGGSWRHNLINPRSACRFNDIPDYRYYHLGLRLLVKRRTR